MRTRRSPPYSGECTRNPSPRLTVAVWGWLRPGFAEYPRCASLRTLTASPIGSRNFSTASLGELPGKGNETSYLHHTDVIEVLGVALLPELDERLTRDTEALARGAVEDLSALFLADLLLDNLAEPSLVRVRHQSHRTRLL